MRQILKSAAALSLVFGVGSVLAAQTYTLKTSVSDTDFDWSAGANYVGEPATGPAAGDTIVIPENVTARVSAEAAAAKGTCGSCDIYVSAGATLAIAEHETNRKIRTYVRTISGPGTVAHLNYSGYDNVQDLCIQKSCTFDGQLAGKMNYYVCNGVTLYLTDADQANLGGALIFLDTSTLKISRFALNGHTPVSSINGSTDSTIEYVGAPGLEETSSAPIWGTGGMTFDAGAYGGFTFSGKIGSTADTQRTYVLKGSNTATCTWSSYLSGGTGPVYYIKEGTGTWKMTKHKSNVSGGVIDVRDGTLEFETIAPAGENCALGFGDNLYKAGTTTLSDAKKVDYAEILGGVEAETEGVLRYTGTDPLDLTTRPVAVRSKGKIVAEDAETVVLDGVTGRGTGEKTFTLATPGDVTATHVDQDSVAARMSFVKEGAGDLTLSGTNTFAGDLVANGGRIRIKGETDPNVRYTWFRFTAKENGYGCPDYDTTYSTGKNDDGSPKTQGDQEKSYLQIAELALFDADGNVLTTGLRRRGTTTAIDDVYDAAQGYAGLEPGMCGFDSRVGQNSYANDAAQNVAALFDGGVNVMAARFGCAATGHGVDIDDETTWVSVVFRLPEGVGEPRYFDVASGRNASGVGSYNGRNLKSYRLEMSADGVTWINAFDDQNDLTVPTEWPHWYTQPTAKINYTRMADTGVVLENLTTWQLYPKNAAFTWFRFTVQENGYGCPDYDTTYSVGTNADGTAKSISNTEKSYVQISEIALYDKDGNNLTGGKITQTTEVTSMAVDTFSRVDGYTGLEPGHVGVDACVGSASANAVNQSLGALFDNNSRAMAAHFPCAANGLGVTPEDSQTWVPIVFRLPEGTERAAYFDVAPGRNRAGVGSYNGRNLTAFRLEGSPDGIHWFKVMEDQTDFTIPETYPRWISQPTWTIDYGARTVGKLPLLERELAPDFVSFTGLGLSGGASAELVEGSPYPISKLMLDATSLPGTLSGFALTEMGTLEISNDCGGPIDFAGLLANTANAENITRWTLTINGEATTRRIRLKADGTVLISGNRGSLILVR